MSSLFLMTLFALQTVSAQTTIIRRVSASADDAEEQGPDGGTPGSMYLNSSDVELVYDPNSSQGTQVVGLRFTNVTVPAGAVIADAYLTFTSDTPDAGNPALNSPVTLTIRGQAADNPTTFTTAANNISSRGATASSVSWTPSTWTSGTSFNSPSLASVVQEVVDRPGWSSGNALVMIVTGPHTGGRVAHAYDGIPGSAPALAVTYYTLSVNGTQQDVAPCPGGANGAIDVTVSGGAAPYTFDWADLPGADDPEDRTGLVAGTYSVTVTDGSGQTGFAEFIIGEPDPILLSTVVHGVYPTGSSNGAINLTVVGGTGPYTNDWADLAGVDDPEDRSGLPVGTYWVTVTDAVGCSATTSVTVDDQEFVYKQLYLSDPGQSLDRVHPGLIVPADTTSASSEVLGVLACGTAGPFRTPALPFSTPTNVSVQFGGNDALVPDMAVFRSPTGIETVHMAFVGKAAGAAKKNVYYSSKTGAGAWTAPILISSDGFNQDVQPSVSIAVDAGNNAHVVFGHKNSVGPPVDAKFNIYYVTNSGGSWSAPVLVSSDAFGNDAATPEVAVDAGGGAHVIYVHKSNVAPDNKKNIYYVTNAGGSWTSPVRVSRDTWNNDVQNGPAIAVDAAGKVHVAYTHKNGTEVPVDTKRNIYYATNVGGSWGGPMRISSDLADNDALDNPSIAVDGSGQPHVVYAHRDSDLGDTQANVYYATRASGSWSVPLDLSSDLDGHDSVAPDLAVSCAGFVRVVFANNGDNIYYTENSGPVGAWQLPLDINPDPPTLTDAGATPSVAVTDHGVQVAFSDHPLGAVGGRHDVWHTRAALVDTLPTLTSFAQTSAVCSSLDLVAGQTVVVTLHTDVLEGSMPAHPAATVTLAEVPGSDFITLSNLLYTAGAGSEGTMTFTGALPGAVTIDTGNVVEMKVSTSMDSVRFVIEYDSADNPSRIDLPTTTPIQLDSLEIYSDAYPAGVPVSQVVPAETYYARVAVSDPFGSADVTGADLVITNTLGSSTHVSLGAAEKVSDDGCAVIYEYGFIPEAAASYDFLAAAHEGYEGVVADRAALTDLPVVPIDAVDDIIGDLPAGTPVIIDVLANDLGDIDPTSMTIVSYPQSGSLQVGVGGEITYLPVGNFSGEDQFSYQVCNHAAPIPDCDTATVSITVTPDYADPCSEAVASKTFYLPYPETAGQLRKALFEASDNRAMSDVVRNITSIKSAYPGAVITYDEWEDGYEADITQPVQSTTKVWGDGNLANGTAPGYPTDLLPAGASIVLDNTFIWNPRDPADIYYDGRDKMSSTGDLSVSKVTGDDSKFAVQNAKTVAQDTSRYGELFVLGLGEVVGLPYFAYASLFIQAEQDGTEVELDLDGDGTVDATQTLNEGEVWFYEGDPGATAIATAIDIVPGTTVTASKPVGVDVLFGGNDAYGTRNINVLPGTFYGNTYYSPVPSSTTAGGDLEPAEVFFVNRLNTPITVNWQSGAPASGSVVVPARSYASLTLASSASLGYKFWSQGGESFTAVEVMDAEAAGSTYDWAITLISAERLTTFTSLAWAPGSLDGTRNDNPIWVTPITNTTVYIKFDGDLTSTNASMSPCGVPYDLAVPINALQVYKVLDASDNDQSGTALFTCDGTPIAAVYGEDPTTALSASPSIDVGTILVPMCLDVLVNAVDDRETTQPDTPVIIGVAGNDVPFLCNVDPLSVSTDGLPPPAHGSIVINPDGTITYLPDPGFTGKDSFDYQICSLEYPAICDIATVYVTVTDCPVLADEVLIAGKVFLEQVPDDGTYNAGETLMGGIKVDLYGDIDCNGVLDAGDPLAQSTISDLSGNYEFTTVPGHYARDDLDPVASFSGNDGSVNWSNHWLEQGDNGILDSGDVQMISDPATGQNAIRIGGPNNGLSRSLTFAGATDAYLRFSYRRENLNDGGEAMLVQVNGTTVYVIDDGNAVGTDNFYQDVVLPLAPGSYNANGVNTLRFISNGTPAITEFFWIDNVELTYITAPVCFITKLDLSIAGGVYLESLLNQQAISLSGSGLCSNDNHLGVMANLVAVDDTASTAVDVPVLIDVLASDVPGIPDPSTVTTNGTSNLVASGTVTVNPDGTISYTPHPGFTGVDDFEYRVCSADDPDVCDVALVTVTVSCIAIPDQNTITGVLFNDLDGDGALGLGEYGYAGQRVNLYLDNNGNGVLEGGEPLIDSQISSLLGGYQFDIPPPTTSNTYLDQFDIDGDPTGSDGTTPWSTPWVEILETDGFDGGDIRVTGNQLRIKKKDKGAYRVANLFGAASATLSFDYDEVKLDDPDFQVTVDVSVNGSSWSNLTTYAGNSSQTGSASFDISSHISATTFVRFFVGPLKDAEMLFDNVQISYITYVPVDYVVQLDQPLPGGYVLTTPPPSPDGVHTAAFAGGGDGDCENHFGLLALGAITGEVREDLDGDGVADADLEGVTVTLYTDSDSDGTGDVVVTNITSAADGSYIFDGLRLGDYVVIETDPGGYTSVSDLDPSDDGDNVANADTNDNAIPVSITFGETDADNAFLDVQPVTVSGRVLVDLDGDGSIDPEDTNGIAGITVQLTEPGGTVAATTTTGTDGSYGFVDVHPGVYLILETDPPGYISTMDTQGDAQDNEIAVTVTGGIDSLENNFYDTALGSVWGTVYVDENGDGVFDPAETNGIPGVAIVLFDSGGALVDATTTGADGSYSFTSLVPGDYTIVETDSAGNLSTGDTEGDPTDNRVAVTLISGQTIVGNDFLDAALPALGISKTVSRDGAVPGVELVLGTVGTPVTYSFEVSNDGGVPLSDVSVNDTDIMPNFSTNLGNLAVGQVITVSVVSVISGDLTNTASVVGQDPYGSPVGPVTDSAQVEAINPSIAVGKEPALQIVEQGSNATFTITVTNRGDVALTDVTVTDALAPACDTTIPNLAAGAIISYVCVVTNVSSDFVNEVSVSATPPAGDDVTDEDSAAVQLTRADLAVYKSAPGFAVAGTIITYEILATNAGPDTATEVVVNESLPAGVTLVSTSASKGSVDTNSLEWTVGSLPASGSATLEISVRIHPGWTP